MKQPIQNTATVLLLAVLLCLTACKDTPSKTAAPRPFTVPEPPVMLTDPGARAAYVATHYWDRFDFTDTALIRRAALTEQALANFIALLARTPQPAVGPSITTMLTRAAADSAVYAHFADLCEKYLYDPNSPLRNEELYIAVLQHIVADPALDDLRKVRPRYQLDLALRNRPGQPAADFTYTTAAGTTRRLSHTRADRLLLFFFEPGCPDCQRVEAYIADRRIAARATILALNPDDLPALDTLYDLRARPLLYLLDKDKKVLLKDAPIEQVDDYLSR